MTIFCTRDKKDVIDILLEKLSICYMRVFIMIFDNNLKFVDIINNKAENNFAELNIVYFKIS